MRGNLHGNGELTRDDFHDILSSHDDFADSDSNDDTDNNLSRTPIDPAGSASARAIFNFLVELGKMRIDMNKNMQHLLTQ